MKKKAKLFTTFASLGLALALMGFGVWAATNQTLGVTSSVGFVPTAVNVEIQAVVNHWKIETDTVSADTKEYVPEVNKGTGDKGYKTPTNDLAAQPAAWDTTGLKVYDDSEAHRWIVYDFTITNYSGFKITASIAQKPAVGETPAPAITTADFYYATQTGAAAVTSTALAENSLATVLNLAKGDETATSGHLYLVVYLNKTNSAITDAPVNFNVVIVEDKTV